MYLVSSFWSLSAALWEEGEREKRERWERKGVGGRKEKWGEKTRGRRDLIVYMKI